jgi:Na+/melibiose symporter-like transporter
LAELDQGIGACRNEWVFHDAGGQFLVNTIMSDVIDYDEFLNGSRSEGAFSVFATLIPKFVAIPASAIPLALINLLGFRQPIAGVAQAQLGQVETFIQVCFVMLPFSCAVLSFLLKFLYPIKSDAIAKLVQDGIEEFKDKREAAEEAGVCSLRCARLFQLVLFARKTFLCTVLRLSGFVTPSPRS